MNELPTTHDPIAPHHSLTGSATADHFIDWIVQFYLAPGQAMMHGLAGTPWGRDWGVTYHWEWAALCSLFFWCILFSILGAMDDRIRSVISRGHVRNRRRTDPKTDAN